MFLGVVQKLSLHFRFLFAVFPLFCQSRMCIRSFQNRGKTAQNNSRTVVLIFERFLSIKKPLAEFWKRRGGRLNEAQSEACNAKLHKGRGRCRQRFFQKDGKRRAFSWSISESCSCLHFSDIVFFRPVEFESLQVDQTHGQLIERVFDSVV
jgi:hypothetical protein